MHCPVERRVSLVSKRRTPCARSLPLPLRRIIVEDQRNLSVCDFVREIFGHESRNSALKHAYQNINRDLATHHIWIKVKRSVPTPWSKSKVFGCVFKTQKWYERMTRV